MKLRFLAVLLFGSTLFAQTPSEAVSPQKVEKPGQVTGHVTLSPQGLPARRAVIQLIPVESQASPVATAGEPDKIQQQMLQESAALFRTITVTNMEGDYEIDTAPPGNYYVHAELPGYVSALHGFARYERVGRTKAVLDALAAEGHAITVESGKTQRVDLSLKKGATLSGVVRYADGPTAGEVILSLLMQQTDGTWKALGDEHPEFTDVRGAFSFAGLLPGKYTIAVRLSPALHTLIVGKTGPLGLMNGYAKEYSMYAGGVPDTKRATVFKLEDAEDKANVEIILPVANLHAISGRVLADTDNHPLNSGNIELLVAEDPKTVYRFSPVEKDGSFHFRDVPEGNYILRAERLFDGKLMEPAVADVELLRALTLKNEKGYSAADQTIILKADMKGIVLKAKDIAAPCPKRSAMIKE